MATFLSRREAKEQKKQEKAEKRKERLYFSDLMWASKRRYLNDQEWYDLHKLNDEYGNWGPERSQYEFGVLEQMREQFKRNAVKINGDPFMNALQKHLHDHNARLEAQEKASTKTIVHAHPTLKKSKANA